jgi:acetyltransferase-like isoleucine patch superfamily enzyme
MHYSKQELSEMGISTGDNVQIHKSVLFFGHNVEIASNVRIDCHCVITSGEKVKIGNNVHLGIGVYLVGTAGITIEDFAGISARCTFFTTSDDYSGGHLTNPTILDKFRKVTAGPVAMEKHALIGSGSVVMPGVTVRRGAAVGALSFVNKSVPEYAVVSGNPLRKIGNRNREQLETLEKQYETETRSY